MQRWEVYAAMRGEGMTYAEIARRCGVTHQCVAQALAKRSIGHFRPYRPEECVYDGLREWMNRERVSKSDIARIFYGKPYMGSSWHSKLKGKLVGRGFKMWEIDKLIDASGLTYEQLFRSGRWCADEQTSG